MEAGIESWRRVCIEFEEEGKSKELEEGFIELKEGGRSKELEEEGLH